MLADHHAANPIEARRCVAREESRLVRDALPNGYREHYHAIQSASLRMIASE